MRAVREAIVRSDFHSVFIRVFSDNTATVHMVNKMYSPVAQCAEELRYLLTYVLSRGCAVKASHVPGPQNTVSDYLSRTRVSSQRVSLVVW